MAGIPNPFRGVQIVVRKGKLLTKVVVMVTILLSIAALVTLRLSQNQVLEQTEEMRQEAAALEFENAQLTEKTENVSTVQGVEQIAQEDLEMVSPDTILIDPD